MSDTPLQPSESDRVEAEAADWMWRLDRGLSPREQDEFCDWLATEPGNIDVLARHRRNWKRLDQLADWRPEHANRPNPDLLAPTPLRRRPSRWLLFPLAAAAALVLAAGLWRQFSPQPTGGGPELAALKPERRQVLADGSSVKLNGDAEVTVSYSATERRLRLVRGEGFFIVAKDPARPFIVEARGVEIRAVGTAFNVTLGSGAVDVLVAEGVVRLAATPAAAPAPSPPPAAAAPTVLAASQRASVALGPQPMAPAVSTLTRPQVQRALAWQHGMMTFDQRPLAAIVAELNLLNAQQLVIDDPAVAAMQFSGTIRSDNVAGFVRLLESGFRVRAEVVAPNQIALRSF
jgi:transmembrane sensor